jgi:hypothetical protein
MVEQAVRTWLVVTHGTEMLVGRLVDSFDGPSRWHERTTPRGQKVTFMVDHAMGRVWVRRRHVLRAQQLEGFQP